MNSPKTYGGFVRDYDPRKPNMHSIYRAEDDQRTLSPEMDEWKKRQLAKQMPDIGKLSDEQTANLSAEHGAI